MIEAEKKTYLDGRKPLLWCGRPERSQWRLRRRRCDNDNAKTKEEATLQRKNIECLREMRGREFLKLSEGHFCHFTEIVVCTNNIVGYT